MLFNFYVMFEVLSNCFYCAYNSLGLLDLAGIVSKCLIIQFYHNISDFVSKDFAH